MDASPERWLARGRLLAGLCVALLLAAVLAGCSSSPVTPAGPISSGPAAASSSPAGPTSSAAPTSRMPWSPPPCDTSGLRALPESTPVPEALRGEPVEVASRLAAAAGATLLQSIAPPATPAGAQAWNTTHGTLTYLPPVGDHGRAQWRYTTHDPERVATWLADPQGRLDAVRAALRLAGLNATRWSAGPEYATAGFEAHVGSLPVQPALQAVAERYNHYPDGVTRVEVEVVEVTLTRHGVPEPAAPAMEAAELRQRTASYLECWMPRQPGHNATWRLDSTVPSATVARDTFLLVQVMGFIRVGTQACSVAVWIEATSGAIETPPTALEECRVQDAQGDRA